MDRLQNVILSKWGKFIIWNAGKQGRKFYNSLTFENKQKVSAMCDVDKNKIGKFYTHFNPITRIPGRTISIVHYQDAEPPFVICVKLVSKTLNFKYNSPLFLSLS